MTITPSPNATGRPPADLAPQSAGSSLAQSHTSLSLQVRSVSDLQTLARVFAASGFFKGTDRAQIEARCAVQLLAGMEAGFTAFASITGVFLVEGKPGFSAQLLAQAIKRHPQYDYRVLEKTASRCRIEFFQRGQSLGVEEFTIEMAQRAGLAGKGVWRSYPEAMLFNRCLSAGMRTHCPDALGCHVAYTPEEISQADVKVDADGMVIDVEDSASTGWQEPAADNGPERDQLQRLALRRLTDAGVRPEGIGTLLRRATPADAPEPYRALGQLPDDILRKLAGVGGTVFALPPSLVEELNAGVLRSEQQAAAASPPQGRPADPAPVWRGAEEEPHDDDYDPPVHWAAGEP